MVRKVAVPARSSVVKEDPLSDNLKRRPTQEAATAALSRPTAVFGAVPTSIGGAISIFLGSPPLPLPPVLYAICLEDERDGESQVNKVS